MIPVSKFSSRQGERVRLIVIHTSQGARDVYSLAAFLRRDGVQASYHGAVDDQRYEAYVNYSNAAWALRDGNQESDNLCLCAFAEWTRAEWLRHPRMLELAAAWIAERCTARRLPIVRLSDAEVGRAMRDDHHPGGVADHDGYSKGTGDGKHWDVGENFPWDIVMRRAQQLAGTATRQAAPGGIETMAFTDKFRDWAGNEQSVLSWMNNVDRRLAIGYGDNAPNDRHFSRRVDTGAARDEIRGDLARLAEVVASLAGDVAEIKALVAAPKDQG